MALKVYKPITAGTRARIDLVRDEITTNRPEKSLTTGKKRNAGRDANGRISVRHKGGGHKRRYRDIDFKRDKHGVPGTVRTIEYDPNRSANIALIFYAEDRKSTRLNSSHVRISYAVFCLKKKKKKKKNKKKKIQIKNNKKQKDTIHKNTDNTQKLIARRRADVWMMETIVAKKVDRCIGQ